MNYQEQWYRDEDVKEMINKIEVVMKKFNIDTMKFESNIEILKKIYNLHKDKPDEFVKRLDMCTPSFHLEFQEGRVKIDL